MFLNLIYVVVGLVVLVAGGELLVRGAASMARSFGVSALVVGLTIVAGGTSAPELVVSVMAASRGNAAICAGNVVGSNIFNVLLIIGVSSMIKPMTIHASIVRREAPIMLGITMLLAVLGFTGQVGRLGAGCLLVVFVAYNVFAVWMARRETAILEPEYAALSEVIVVRSTGMNVLFVLAGLLGLAGGSELFLRGAIEIARSFGISELIIGLTLVAVGTSLPELVTSVVAALRGQSDIAIGNVIGSNVFNISGILGVSGMIQPIPLDSELLWIHLPIMVGTSALLWLLIATRSTLSRREGVLLFAGFLGYLGWLMFRPAA
ncbi:MAG: calcium/sodium antiporter [Phycisphaerae bacterium]|nr:calcium/sodium antiporter [Phycisphaerae bacterium]